MSENPLLKTDFVIPFDEIETEHVVSGLREALDLANERLERIAATADAGAEVDYANSLGALDELAEGLYRPYALVGHLNAVNNSPELRTAFNEVQPEVVAFFARVTSDQRVWSVLKRFAESEEGRALTGVARRHLEKTMDSFRRAGADLNDEDRKRVESLKVELARLSTKFGENVLDSTNAFELLIEDEEQLAGLPASAVRRAKAAAEAKGEPCNWESAALVIHALTKLPPKAWTDQKLDHRVGKAMDFLRANLARRINADDAARAAEAQLAMI